MTSLLDYFFKTEHHTLNFGYAPTLTYVSFCAHDFYTFMCDTLKQFGSKRYENGWKLVI